MIISGKQIQNVIKTYSEQSKVNRGAKTQATSPAQHKDEVILSSQAQELGQIYQTIKNIPDVREDKVKELSERYEASKYQVDAKAIAEKMLGRTRADRSK